jgi:hypothetical protein
MKKNGSVFEIRYNYKLLVSQLGRSKQASKQAHYADSDSSTTGVAGISSAFRLRWDESEEGLGAA